MVSFGDKILSFMHTNAAQNVDWETFPAFHGELQLIQAERLSQISYQGVHNKVTHDLGRVKRGSKALVIISPETNEPIEHYRSDQSSSSGQSVLSDDPVGEKKQMMPAGVGGGLPMGSKLHRWMGNQPKCDWSIEPAIGLYYNDSSIWQEGNGVHDCPSGVFTFDKIDATCMKGARKSSRLWTWLGDQETSELNENRS